MNCSIESADSVMFRESAPKRPNNSDSESSSSSSSVTPSTSATKKSKKRLSYFNNAWLNEFSWLKKHPFHLKEHQKTTEAYCVICKKQFSVQYKGYSALRIHEDGQFHKSLVKAGTSSQLLTKFYAKKNTSEQNDVTATELTYIFHTIKHSLSYNSLDCDLKLASIAFHDSAIASKLSCGRTKSSMIVQNVLAPYLLERVLLNLRSNKVFFSIQTDASNKKNRKFFPICVQYFDKANGIQNKILDFIENADETALGMYSMLKNALDKLNLNMHYVTALSADNTNSNFGKHNSLYTHLKEDNKTLFKANCNAHVIHNSLKNSLNNLDIDVENIVLKIYAHFSIASKKRDKFIEFCDFVDVEFREILRLDQTRILRHVTTRWLSLLPAIDRIILIWPALKSYFLSEDIPKVLKDALLIKDNMIPDKIEIYLTFLSHSMQIYRDTTLKLEANTCTVLDLDEILKEFRTKLTNRLDQSFFGINVRQKLANLNSIEQNTIKSDFNKFLKSTIEYVDKRYDFQNGSIGQKLSKMSLSTACFTFEDIMNIVEEFKLNEKIETLDCDRLFDEVDLIRTCYQIVHTKDDFTILKTSEKFVHIFENVPDINNCFQIVSYILSMPGSSAFSERVFSIMNQKWSDERNRCSVSLIKSEIIIYFNEKSNCSQFFEIAKKDEKLLNLTKSNEKYVFKR